MIFSIRSKLTIIFIMLILVPLAVINYLSISNMQESIFSEVEVNTLKSANVIAGISRDGFDDIPNLKSTIRQYSTQIEGRLLVINQAKEVLIDSFNLLEGGVIDNKEIRNGLNLQERIGYYSLDERILQVGVPIINANNGERRAIGVVILSLSVEDLFREVEGFRQRLLFISITALVIGILVAFIVSSHIARPIIALSDTAKRIGRGNLGETLDIKSKDEIGRLVENFNHMSKELYRVDKGRMQFIGDVSHELKTPLAAMKALIDSLLYGEEDIDVFKEYLRDMDMEIDRLTELIKALLSLTKLEETGINPQLTPIKEEVDDAIKILKPLWQQKGIQVRNEMSGDVKVLCDKERIKEVFINLIGNAIKYCDIHKDVKEIKIKGKIEKDAFTLLIEDNGIGIGEKDLEHIFEKFYRTDFSRSRDTGGAGIGLSIVEGIIKLHNWRIEIVSQRKVGTTFIITIPKNSFEISL